MNIKIDEYIANGCGRCPLGSTPQYKVNFWRGELNMLRGIINRCGLEEELKWSMPCYTFEGKNILILSAFKDYCSINFFKGALLPDKNNILVQPTENTQASRLLRYTSVKDIINEEEFIIQYIKEAIEIEKAGLEVKYKSVAEYDVPEELIAKFEESAEFKKAFEKLTPGRQKGYYLYFSAPKQSKTRSSRIEKLTPKIFSGKGYNER